MLNRRGFSTELNANFKRDMQDTGAGTHNMQAGAGVAAARKHRGEGPGGAVPSRAARGAQGRVV